MQQVYCSLILNGSIYSEHRACRPSNMGYQYGYKTILEAMNDKRIYELIEGVQRESEEVLIRPMI